MAKTIFGILEWNEEAFIKILQGRAQKRVQFTELLVPRMAERGRHLWRLSSPTGSVTQDCLGTCSVGF